MRDQITPLILTFNEAPNLPRTLEKLKWAKEIVVLDSFSTDETLDIARSFRQVRVTQRRFDDHTTQWNHGVDQVRTDWVLALDADYVLTPELVHELEALPASSLISAYFARFKYCVHGHPLRGSLYPPRAVLFLRSRCRYEEDGHTQLLRIDGPKQILQGFIHHDDRKPISRWLWAQDRYAVLEVEKLLTLPTARLRLQDRLRRRIFIAPVLVFFYTLLFKGLTLDGWPGCYYVLQRTLAEIILSLRLTEARLTGIQEEPQS
jgi:glycosyltransferase involved in cell wall biosynthesis